jgi:hypothetical protein
LLASAAALSTAALLRSSRAAAEGVADPFHDSTFSLLGQGAPAPMGLGFVITQRGPNKGIFHNGEWPGERSFTGLRPDGRSFALLVNSDDGAHVGQILAATTHALDGFDAASAASVEWRDYGFAS